MFCQSPTRIFLEFIILLTQCLAKNTKLQWQHARRTRMVVRLPAAARGVSVLRNNQIGLGCPVDAGNCFGGGKVAGACS